MAARPQTHIAARVTLVDWIMHNLGVLNDSSCISVWQVERWPLQKGETPSRWSHAELLYHLILTAQWGSHCLSTARKTRAELLKWCHRHFMNALDTPTLTKPTGGGAAPLCPTAGVWISSLCRYSDAASCTVSWLWGGWGQSGPRQSHPIWFLRRQLEKQISSDKCFNADW